MHFSSLAMIKSAFVRKGRIIMIAIIKVNLSCHPLIKQEIEISYLRGHWLPIIILIKKSLMTYEAINAYSTSTRAIYYEYENLTITIHYLIPCFYFRIILKASMILSCMQTLFVVVYWLQSGLKSAFLFFWIYN